MFCLSLELTFQPDFISFEDNFYNAFTLFALIVDILIKLKTSFYDHGILIRNNRKIIQNYYKTDFFSDIIPTVMMLLHIIFGSYPYMKWVIVIFFLKIKSIRKIIQNYEKTVDLGEGYELFVVMFKVLCIAHIYACFWHYISYGNADPDQNTWITAKNLQNADWKIQYIYSIYWALATMVTVGYGDITPQNPFEILFCMFTILSGAVVFGYSFNRIGTLLTNIDERDKEIK